MTAPLLQPFVPNDYRKRVLAVIERRGGPDESDAFELYDIPLEAADAVSDDAAAARIDEVWAFWQKHRDHPKYRLLVGRLVAEHDERSAPLRFATSRMAQARAVTALREQRDADRYFLLDNAIERLQSRYGGIPAAKRAGLDDIGAMSGLTPDQVATRVRRYRIIDDAVEPAPSSPATSAPTLTERRLNQIDELLSQFNRLRDAPPAPTLFGMLHLTIDDAADRGLLEARTESLAERARELRAGRLRAVIDELILHIRDVLLRDSATATAYATAMTDRVADFLRPRIRAAVLVEDELVAEDQEHLLSEAIEHGMGPVGAAQLIGSIAAEFGARTSIHPPGVPGGQSAAPAPTSHRPPRPPTDNPFAGAAGPPPTPTSTPTPAPTPRRDWSEPLRAARAMLRSGRPVQARSLITRARRIVGDDAAGTRQITPVAEEIERAVSAAQLRWQQALADAEQGRHPEALESLEWLARHASDIDILRTSGPRLVEVIETSRRAATAAAQVSNPPAAPINPISPAGPVSAESLDDGTVRVRWLPSPAPGATYRVARQMPDGRWQTVGRTPGTELADGGAAGPEIPVYEVTAVVDGVYADPVRSDASATAVSDRSSTVPDPALPDIVGVAATADRVTFVWPSGITEAMVVIRSNEPPVAPDDPQSTAIKVTIARYEIDGGVVVPDETARPCHVAVASCRRDRTGALVVATVFGPAARAEIG